MTVGLPLVFILRLAIRYSVFNSVCVLLKQNLSERDSEGKEKKNSRRIEVNLRIAYLNMHK